MKRQVDGIASIALAATAAMLVSFGANRAGAEQQAPGQRLKVRAAPIRAAAPQRVVARVQPVPAKAPQRFGSVIELLPQKKEYYIKLHAETWPSVLTRIRKCNIRNYSIYMAELGGKLYLFSYFEYVGDDFEADMQAMADDPETQRWWKETDPCQKRLPNAPEGEQWLGMPEVFHTD